MKHQKQAKNLHISSDLEEPNATLYSGSLAAFKKKKREKEEKHALLELSNFILIPSRQCVFFLIAGYCKRSAAA